MRRILEKIKKLFTKEVVTIHQWAIIVKPDRRDINYTKLMPTSETAQALYDYIYNKHNLYMTRYDKETAEVYRDLLVEIKQLAEKQWHQVKL